MKRKWILRARQKDIVEWYREDIAKRAGDRALVVKRIFDLIPHKLSGRNKRFVAKSIEGKASIERYENDLLWLVDASVGLASCNVSEPRVPLAIAVLLFPFGTAAPILRAPQARVCGARFWLVVQLLGGDEMQGFVFPGAPLQGLGEAFAGEQVAFVRPVRCDLRDLAVEVRENAFSHRLVAELALTEELDGPLRVVAHGLSDRLGKTKAYQKRKNSSAMR